MMTKEQIARISLETAAQTHNGMDETSVLRAADAYNEWLTSKAEVFTPRPVGISEAQTPDEVVAEMARRHFLTTGIPKHS